VGLADESSAAGRFKPVVKARPAMTGKSEMCFIK